MVVRNGGTYTKHIYMGGQRIVSKLGDMDSYGEDPRRIEYAGAEAEAQNGQSVMPDYKAKYKLSYEVMKARYDSLEVPYRGTDNDDYQGGEGFCCTPEAEAVANRSSRTVDNNENPELLQYFYHADHLGSSSYITNLDGEVAQHIEYVPFGEVFIEERNNTWNTPYLFNGKELDEETGLYYYGARYYNPRVSQWLSVDPLAEVNPSRSPYEYTYSNPVRFIDPTGMIGEEPCETCHTVKKGETLSSIAKDNSISTDNLRSINNLDPNNDRNLQIGTELNVIPEADFRDHPYNISGESMEGTVKNYSSTAMIVEDFIEGRIGKALIITGNARTQIRGISQVKQAENDILKLLRASSKNSVIDAFSAGPISQNTQPVLAMGVSVFEFMFDLNPDSTIANLSIAKEPISALGSFQMSARDMGNGQARITVYNALTASSGSERGKFFNPLTNGKNPSYHIFMWLVPFKK